MSQTGLRYSLGMTRGSKNVVANKENGRCAEMKGSTSFEVIWMRIAFHSTVYVPPSGG
jgi:hypothetical protein